MTELEAGIVGRDRAQLVAFYAHVMGFELAQELAFEGIGAVLKFRRDQARLKLFFPATPADAAPSVDPWSRLSGWRYAALYVDSVDALQTIVGRAPSMGGAVVTEPRSHRANAMVAVIADPEGNHWELLCERAEPE